jgi:hypothetical protein
VIIFWSLMLALWLAVLVGNFVKRKLSSTALRWLAAGMLLMATNMIVREVATGHRWPPSQLRAVDAVGHWSAVVALVCGGVSVFILIRSGQWVRRQPNSGVGDGRP